MFLSSLDVEVAAVRGQLDSDVPAVELAAAVEAWHLAATNLVQLATEVTVEDLARQARAVHDMLDPVGAEERFHQRREQRSFSLRADLHGVTRGTFVFDDEGASWVRTIIDSALRPRRGL